MWTLSFVYAMFFFLDKYVIDPRTGKQYISLDTETLNHDINQEICRTVGGHLPEPRDEGENLFLSRLGADRRFVLGMKEDKGIKPKYSFDSDGSPVGDWANKVWPTGDKSFPCVGMVFNGPNWFDLTCESSRSYDNENLIVVICQKGE